MWGGWGHGLGFVCFGGGFCSPGCTSCTHLAGAARRRSLAPRKALGASLWLVIHHRAQTRAGHAEAEMQLKYLPATDEKEEPMPWRARAMNSKA